YRGMDHSGSSFDGFLAEEGLREEIEAVAIKAALARQLKEAMCLPNRINRTMARDLDTSPAQLDDDSNQHPSTASRPRGARHRRIYRQLQSILVMLCGGVWALASAATFRQ